MNGTDSPSTHKQSLKSNYARRCYWNKQNNNWSWIESNWNWFSLNFLLYVQSESPPSKKDNYYNLYRLCITYMKRKYLQALNCENHFAPEYQKDLNLINVVLNAKSRKISHWKGTLQEKQIIHTKKIAFSLLSQRVQNILDDFNGKYHKVHYVYNNIY